MLVPVTSTMPSSCLPSRRAASMVASSTAWNRSNTCFCAAGSSPSSLRCRQRVSSHQPAECVTATISALFRTLTTNMTHLRVCKVAVNAPALSRDHTRQPQGQVTVKRIPPPVEEAGHVALLLVGDLAAVDGRALPAGQEGIDVDGRHPRRRPDDAHVQQVRPRPAVEDAQRHLFGVATGGTHGDCCVWEVQHMCTDDC